MIVKEKIEAFVSKFLLLLPVAKKLNDAGINWMIGGSGCLFLLGNERVPQDVDIVLLDDEHDKADALFDIAPYTYNSSVESVRNSNPEGDHSIQFTSHIKFNLDKEYRFLITPIVVKKKIRFKYKGTDFCLLSPEDVLLIKALLQRGPKEGKKDIEDIRNFSKIYQIDHNYLAERIKELGAEERVGNIFVKL